MDNIFNQYLRVCTKLF